VVLPSTAEGFTALAADEVGQRFFGVTNVDNLYSVDYATRTATFIGEITTDPDDFLAGIGITGLAYDTTRNILYGTNAFGDEGFYTIDLTTAEPTFLLNYEDLATGTSTFQIDGIDYDPSSDTIFFADDDATGGRGLYSAPGSDPTNITFLAAYPDGVTDVDGLGAGDGRVYLLSDSPEGNGGNHFVYDVASDTFSVYAESPYDARPLSSLGLVNPSGGGAFAPSLIPEPGSAAALMAVAGLGLLRRRGGRA
jgi:hypothetical protein